MSAHHAFPSLPLPLVTAPLPDARSRSRWARPLSMTLTAVLFVMASGCSSPPFTWYHHLPAKPASARLTAIKPGDRINVFVQGQAELSGQFDVASSGDYPQPLVGSVQVAGLSPEEASKHVMGQLGRFIQSPNVQVTIAVPGPNRVTILGEVADPGTLSLTYDQSLLDALAGAGGLTPFADKSAIYVVRLKPDPLRIRFSYDALVKPDSRATGFALENGDTIVVE